MKFLETWKLFESNPSDEYPLIRIITTKKSYDSIKEMGYIYSRTELMKKNNLDKELIKDKGFDDKNDEWFKNRSKNDNEKFKTDDLIFATADWFNDGGYETGHGSIMMYLKPTIFDDFKITLTETDSFEINKKLKIYNKKDIKKIYSFIKNIDVKSNDELLNVAKNILKNLKHKNKQGFYDKYSEIQIHTNKIPIEYIKEIKITKNYLKK